MRAGIFYCGCFAVGLAITLPCAAAGQVYRFTKVLDDSTQRPDGAGPFFIRVSNTPAFDGRWVVLRDPGPQNDDGSHAAIWSFDTLDGTFHKLVDFNTSVPGGAAMFNDLQLSDTTPSVRNGTVIFLARDTSLGSNREGLYSVSAAGNPVAKIADYNTPNPSGGTFTVFDTFGKQIGGFSFDGTAVAFNANGSAMTLGNYSAKPDGSSLGLIADSLHPYTSSNGKVSNFNVPVISGGNVVMIGTDGHDPRTGYSGIYLGTVGGDGTVEELLNSSRQLPANPNSSFHTRFDTPSLGMDGTFVAFRAADSNSGFFGLYRFDLTAHAIDRIVDVNSSLPGLGKLTEIATGGVAVNREAVLFKAGDSSGNKALYLWKNGTAIRVIGKGDRLDGRTVQDVADPGPAALYGSDLVINVDFGRGRGLYVASEAFASVSAASYVSGMPLAAGSIVSGFGHGLASETAAATLLPLPTTLARTTVRVTDSTGVEREAPLLYVSPPQINYLVPDGMAVGPATVTVTSAGQSTAMGAMNIDLIAPALFTANFDGKGAPAGEAIAVHPNSTQTRQAVARCGLANG